jgi:lipopolysaccharide export system protein LptA
MLYQQNKYMYIHQYLKVDILLILIFFQISLFGQERKDTAKVNLISAEMLKYDKSINPDFQILDGNVIFEYDGSLLYSDRTHIYIHRDYIENYGNVHIIINDSTHIYGDTLTIDGEIELAEIYGNVKLIDNNITLTTSTLFYNLQTDVAYYNNWAEIINERNYLKSVKGKYYTNTKDFHFYDSVFFKNDDIVMHSDSLLYNTNTEIAYFFGKSEIISDENTLLCEYGYYDTKNDIGRFSQNATLYSGNRILTADSLFYTKPSGYAEAFFNVELKDTIDNYIVNGHYGKYFETDSSFIVTNSALLRLIEKKDTLYMHADSLLMFNDTLHFHQNVIRAYYMARIFRKDFQAVCDSLIYLREDSLLFLYNNPVMWLDSTQLLADTIKLELQNEELETLYLYNNAFVISKENVDDFQQIKSKNMFAYFVDNELDHLWAHEDVETLYYIFDELEKLIGINIAKSEKVKIQFWENEVDRIIFYQNPSGTMNPEEQLSKEKQKLSGFEWFDGLRPQFPADVFRNPKIEPYPQKILLPSDTSLIVPMQDSIISDSIHQETFPELATDKSSKRRIDSAKDFISENDYLQKSHTNEGIIKRWWKAFLRLLKKKR